MFRRGEAAPRYSNALTAAGQWQATPALRAAIETERARAWTAEETADFLRTHSMLRRELGAQWAQRLDEILGQAQPLMGQAPETASEPSLSDDVRQTLEAARAAKAPETASEPSLSDDVRQTLEAARAANAAASARQASRRQAAAEAEEADRRQAHWQAMADQQREARWQREPAEGDAGAGTEPEAGK